MQVGFVVILGTIALQQLGFCLNGELLQVQSLLCLLARYIQQLLLVLGVECQPLDLHRLTFLELALLDLAIAFLALEQEDVGGIERLLLIQLLLARLLDTPQRCLLPSSIDLGSPLPLLLLEQCLDALLLLGLLQFGKDLLEGLEGPPPRLSRSRLLSARARVRGLGDV